MTKVKRFFAHVASAFRALMFWRRPARQISAQAALEEYVLLTTLLARAQDAPSWIALGARFQALADRTESDLLREACLLRVEEAARNARATRRFTNVQKGYQSRTPGP